MLEFIRNVRENEQTLMNLVGLKSQNDRKKVVRGLMMEQMNQRNNEHVEPEQELN